MTSALVSDAFKCGLWLTTSAQIEWPVTGTPVGSFAWKGSNNSTDGVNGNWRPITLTADKQPTGAADGDLVDFSSEPWLWIRCEYTPVSGGAGALPTVTFLGKRRG